MPSMSVQFAKWSSVLVIGLFAVSSSQAVTISHSDTEILTGEFVPPPGGWGGGDTLIVNDSISSTFFWGSVTPDSQPKNPIEEPWSSWVEFLDELIPESSPATLGTFTYYNASSDVGTGVEFVDFKVSIKVDGVEQMVTFPLQIKNQYNSVVTDPFSDANADRIRFFIRSIDLGGGSFLNLEFVPDGDPDGSGAELDSGGYNAFQVLEGQSASAQIRATIGGYLPPVPDPAPPGVPDAGSTLAFLGSAFLLMSTACRRRDAYASSAKI